MGGCKNRCSSCKTQLQEIGMWKDVYPNKEEKNVYLTRYKRARMICRWIEFYRTIHIFTSYQKATAVWLGEEHSHPVSAPRNPLPPVLYHLRAQAHSRTLPETT